MNPSKYIPFKTPTPLVTAFGLILGILGIVATYHAANQAARVQISDVINILLYTTDKATEESKLVSYPIPKKLSFTYDGKPTGPAILRTWAVQNIGNLAIRSEDYHEPLRIVLPDDQKFIAAWSVGDAKNGLQPEWSISDDGKTATMSKTLLNPDDMIDLSAIISVKPDYRKPEGCEWKARIATVKHLEFGEPKIKTYTGIGISFIGFFEQFYLSVAILAVFISLLELYIHYDQIPKLRWKDRILIYAFVLLALLTGTGFAAIFSKCNSIIWYLWIINFGFFLGFLAYPIMKQKCSSTRSESNRE